MASAKETNQAVSITTGSLDVLRRKSSIFIVENREKAVTYEDKRKGSLNSFPTRD